MINRSHRFHGRGSLKYVYQKGQTIRGNQITLRYVTNERRPKYRAAVIVSRKVSKSAVVRNRIRRRIFACLAVQSSVENGPVMDYVVTVFNDCYSTMPAEQLQQTVTELVQRAHHAAKTS